MLKYYIICISFFNVLLSMQNPNRSRPISVCGSYDQMNIEYKSDPTWTDLHDAAYHCADIIYLRSVAEQTLRLTGTVDSRDKFGQTPLWWAVHNGKKEAVILLLFLGANPSITDMFNRSVRSKMLADPQLKILLTPGIKP